MMSDRYIYFAQASPDGLIKIGSSFVPHHRVAQLSKLYREPGLTLLASFAGDFPEERKLHQRFLHLVAPRRYLSEDGWHDSNEWFLPEPELVDYIAAIKKGWKADLEEELLRSSIVVRLSPELRAALDELCFRTRRPRDVLLLHALETTLKAAGLWPPSLAAD